MNETDRCIMLSQHHGGDIHYFQREEPLPGRGSVVVTLCANCRTNLNNSSFRKKYIEISQDEAFAFRIMED